MVVAELGAGANGTSSSMGPAELAMERVGGME